MIVNIFALLLALGALSLIFSKGRNQRFVSFLLFSAVAFLLVIFAENWLIGTVSPYKYHLLEYQTLHFDVYLNSSAVNYALIFPFFLLTAFSLLNNVFSAQEDQRVRLSGLMLINLSFLMLLACANDFIMLIVSSSLMGIIGLYVINDFEAKKNYIFYNLAADMGMFTAFAIIFGQFNRVGIAVIEQYAAYGEHLPLVSGLLLISLFIKSGLFLFQNQTFSYRDLTFNRLLFLSFCAAPAAGLVVFLKCLPLFAAWEFAPYLLYVFAALSIAYGFGGTLVYDNIKEKALSLNMVMWGFLYVAAFEITDFSLTAFFWLLFLFYLLNHWLALIVAASSDEIYISRMGGFFRPLWTLFGLGIILSWVFIQNIWLGVQSHVLFGWYAVLLAAMLVSISYLLRQIFFGQTCCDEKVWAFLKQPNPLRWLPGLALLGWIAYEAGDYSYPIWIAFTGMLFLIWAYPLRQIAEIYHNDEFQLSEFFNRAYDLLILAPLSILGRILWLLVDFLIIERTIITSISKFTALLIRISQRVNSSRLLNYILMSVLGIGIMFLLVRIKS